MIMFLLLQRFHFVFVCKLLPDQVIDILDPHQYMHTVFCLLESGAELMVFFFVGVLYAVDDPIMFPAFDPFDKAVFLEHMQDIIAVFRSNDPVDSFNQVDKEAGSFL